MSLVPGARLGPYQILVPLGAGGMGEVYRARDTNLDRDVAIKVLPTALAQDPERLARFEREAKVLAALNHPNIAQIYGVEQGALVMELVEGENLSGPVPLATALDYARQIADALEAAHEKGIVHRDLKPANIKVTPQGVVKVLDFGLAAVAQPTGSRADASVSPTLTMAATQMGVLLGTAGYMSPEQAAGKPVDKRADIWSFGVVMWELFTGRRLFDGETISHTLAAVLTQDLDWTQLPAGIPASVRTLLRHCLARDLRRRLPDIGAARLTLEDALTGQVSDAPVPVLRPHFAKLPWLLMSVVALAALALFVLYERPNRPADRPLMRLNVDIGPDALAGNNLTAAISPDGTRLVFAVRDAGGKQLLSTQLLSQSKATPLPGTEGGFDPFFSPDGQWIGFFASSQLKKISVEGGAPVTLCDVTAERGASWGEDGIVAALNFGSGLSRVPPSGGTPAPLTSLEPGELTHRQPQVLPGGQAVIFTASRAISSYENANIDILSLKTGQRKTVVHGGYYGRYLATNGANGHLVYVHEGTLFAVPFDPVRFETHGNAVPVLDDVAGKSGNATANFAFSQTGTAVYLRGNASLQRKIGWLESTGDIQALLPLPGTYVTPRLSPDGRLVAFAGAPAGPQDLWVYDWQRENISRMTSNGQANRSPVWSPDGRHIIFSSQPQGGAIWWMRADGAGEAQPLMQSTNFLESSSISPDGKRLAFDEFTPETNYDIWTLPLDTTDPEHPKPGKPEVFLRSQAYERSPMFSPDGKWMAYSSSESGKNEIYVRPFPGPGGKWQISTGGGLYPVWSHSGRELYFLSPGNRIMAAAYSIAGGSFEPGKPRLWSSTETDNPNYPMMDPSPDGKRFLVLLPTGTDEKRQGPLEITLLFNFFDELRRRAPAGVR